MRKEPGDSHWPVLPPRLSWKDLGPSHPKSDSPQQPIPLEISQRDCGYSWGADWQPWALCGRGLCQPSLQFRCSVLMGWLTICRACRRVSFWSLINVLTTRPYKLCKTGTFEVLADNVLLLPPFQVQDFLLLKQAQFHCWFEFIKTIYMS